jgi:YVTN family beta-propeller protein
VAVVPVGRHPFGLAIDPTGERAYAANVESDDVSVIDIAARRVIATLPAGSRPYTVALAGGRIFVANQHADSLSVFETAGFTRVGEVRVGEYPEGVGATRDGAVVVACWFSNELWAIDAATLKVRAVAATADGPRAFGNFVRPAP